MKVLVDTSVWSLYFRRHKTAVSDTIRQLRELITEGRVILPGIVKQELLSGIRDPARFSKLNELLSGYEVLLATDLDHILAAEYFNHCRAHGIQGSFYDFLICAQATNHRMAILTTDQDFSHYAKYIPVKLLD